MSGRMDYPNIRDGSVTEQLRQIRNETRKFVDQLNMILSELDRRIDAVEKKM